MDILTDSLDDDDDDDGTMTIAIGLEYSIHWGLLHLLPPSFLTLPADCFLVEVLGEEGSM